VAWTCLLLGDRRRVPDAHRAIGADIHQAVATRDIPLDDFGQPEDLGPLAVYLASDASRYMTGAALVIDGGHTLW